MPDYLRDFRQIIGHIHDGSRLKRERLLRKVDRFEYELKRAGGDVNRYPQAKLVEALCADGHGEFREMMFRFCLARLYRGEFGDWTGWEYRDDWTVSTYAQPKRWRLQETDSIAILGEQGVGDEIMFLSCLPAVISRVARVVVECDRRIQGVVARSFGVDVRDRLNLSDDRPEAYFLPMGDMARLFRKEPGAFPGTAYLKPLPEMVEKWGKYKGKTGLAWRSRTGQYKPADFGLDGAVCLQYDPWPHELKGLEVPECDLRNDIEDLMGICANLERVVTVPQTIVHIAGSIGCRVDVVMPPVGSSRVTNQIPWRYGLV